MELRSLLFERQGAGRDLVVSRGELGLRSGERALGLGQPLALVIERLLSYVDGALALDRCGVRRLRLRVELPHPCGRLGLGCCDRPLPVGDRGHLLRKLRRRGGTLFVRRLQLVDLEGDGLLALGDPDGCRVDLGAEALQLGVAFVEFSQALVDATLLLLQNPFAFVQLSCSLLELCQAPSELVLELGLARRGVELLAERRAQLMLARA